MKRYMVSVDERMYTALSQESRREMMPVAVLVRRILAIWLRGRGVEMDANPGSLDARVQDPEPEPEPAKIELYKSEPVPAPEDDDEDNDEPVTQKGVPF